MFRPHLPSGCPPAPGEVVAGLVDGPLATAVAAATVREAVARGARIRFLQILPADLGAAAHTTAASFLFGIAPDAEQLSLAEKTVKNYVTAVLVKLGMQSRTQAAVSAVTHRGLDAPGTSLRESRGTPHRGS